MKTSNNLKICVCGTVASVFIGSAGLYFCEKCSKEKHDHEPVKSQSITFLNTNIGTTLMTGNTSIEYPSPSIASDGSS